MVLIQDIYPHVFDNHFVHPVPKKDDLLLCYLNGNILLMSKNSAYSIPTIGDLQIDRSEDFFYLFALDDTNCFLWIGEELPPTVGLEYKPINFIRSGLGQEEAFLGATGSHISGWLRNNAFCGKCGAKRLPSDTERALICSKCGNIIYPTISPAIIVAVTYGDKVLMGRKSADSNRYSLIAGYCEIGESLEETVRREVWEEAGIKVKDIKYYASQPWAFSSALMVGFTAVLDGDPTITTNDGELYEARWFDRSNTPAPSNNMSIGSQLVHAFINGEI